MIADKLDTMFNFVVSICEINIAQCIDFAFDIRYFEWIWNMMTPIWLNI